MYKRHDLKGIMCDSFMNQHLANRLVPYTRTLPLFGPAGLSQIGATAGGRQQEVGRIS